MRVKLLSNVANDKRGDIITVSAEAGEKLIRTGYATTAPVDAAPKGKAA